MALIAKASGESTFTPVPAGMHLARCYRVIDMGTQKTEYLGTVKHLPKVMLQFEVHSEDDNGKPLVTSKNEPMSISKNFTLSLAEKATLRKDLVAWRGREFTQEELSGFELKNVLGVWAMLSIAKSTGNNGKEYTNIVSINPVPPSIKKAGLPEPHNKIAIFSIDEFNEELFETFGDNLKNKIKMSPEYMARKGVDYQKNENAGTFSDMEDDIPF